MKNLSSEARSLVEAARGGDAPSPADSARVKRALASAIAAGAAGTSASTAAAATRSAAPSGTAGAGITAGKIAGWVGIGATVGLATAGTWAAFSGSSKDEPHPPSTAAAAAATATAAVTAVEVPTEVVAAPEAVAPQHAMEPADPVTPSPAKHAVTAARVAPRAPARALPQVSSLAAETALIQSARAALGGGDAHGALALLREHARDYPSGILVEERLASQVFASCALGQRANAARAAAELIRRAPSSPLRARVLDSCAGPR